MRCSHCLRWRLQKKRNGLPDFQSTLELRNFASTTQKEKSKSKNFYAIFERVMHRYRLAMGVVSFILLSNWQSLMMNVAPLAVSWTACANHRNASCGDTYLFIRHVFVTNSQDYQTYHSLRHRLGPLSLGLPQPLRLCQRHRRAGRTAPGRGGGEHFCGADAGHPAGSPAPAISTWTSCRKTSTLDP